MRILFMGTPDFAAVILKRLAKSRHEVTAVISQPDKPKGRGHKLTPTDVKKAAEELGICVYQPESLKNNAIAELLEEINPDVIAVAAYGKILPRYVLEYPKYGCINVHASLLPKYRGAAPIQRAVINGDKVTGVTTMLMETGLDTGDMLLKEETEIGEYETSEELFDRLAVMGGELLIKTLDGVEEGSIIPQKQNEEESSYAPMIKKEDAEIDWSKPVREISKLICGMNSWPLAYTAYMGSVLKIVSADYRECDCDKENGSILGLDNKKGLIVAANGGELYIKTAQFAGSKKMNVSDYARGHNIDMSAVLGKEVD